MARFHRFTPFLLLSFAALLLPTDSSLIKAIPQSPGAAGVFMVTDGGEYTFNFTAARAACLSLNVTMATMAQMERALRGGLETCKYGWIAEQIAVIPRVTSHTKCGKGNIGVVQWFANPDKKFGAFCFNASEETPNRSTANPQSSTSSATPTPPSRTSTPATPLPPSTATPPPPTKPATTTERTSFALTLLVETTPSKRISSTSASLKSFSTPNPTSHLVTSTPAITSSVFSTSVQASIFSVSSESLMLPTARPTEPSLGDVPTALIVLGVILLLLTAAGVVWYYKLNIFTLWSQGQQKDETETEMWKRVDSEMDLNSQYEEEEEDRKYSSDIMLCVNPDIRIISLD